MSRLEQKVIGALLLTEDPAMLESAFSRLAPEFFHTQEFSALFREFREQFAESGKIDLTIAQAHLGDGLNGIVYTCMEQAQSGILLPQYVSALFESHRKDVLAQGVFALNCDLSRPEFSASEGSARLEELLRAQEGFAQISESTSMEMLDSVVEFLCELSKRDHVGIKTGMRSFDRMTGGFLPKAITTLSGRSGSGKSDFAITLACAAAAEGAKVLYLSMEMPRTQIISRIASRVSMIDSELIRDKRLDAEQIAAMSFSLDAVSKLPMVLDEQQNLTLYDIQAKIRQHKPQLVVIDHIGLMKSDPRRKQWEVTAENSKGLKQIAMRENISILELVQQTRDVENRKDKTAKLSDMKGSDGLGNDADVALFIRAQQPDGILTGGAWIDAVLQLEKNRDGKRGEIRYHWQPQYHKYTEEQRDV